MGEDLFYKIVMLGDATVGKTTLVKAFMGGEIKEGYRVTLGADIGRKNIKIEENNTDITFQIWDLSGQQSFKEIRTTFYKGSKGAILVYDISKRKSFENLPEWIQELWNTCGVIPMVIVGNKTDLREKGKGEVTIEDGNTYAQSIANVTNMSTPFIEACAIRRENADNSFIKLGKLILGREN